MHSLLLIVNQKKITRQQTDRQSDWRVYPAFRVALKLCIKRSPAEFTCDSPFRATYTRT